MTAKAAAKPKNQPRGVRRVRTIVLILSVIEAKVWPGSMTGAGPAAARPGVCGRSGCTSGGLRVGVADGREVRRPGAGVELPEEGVVALVGLQASDPARRVVDVAEDDGLGRTDRLAGGHDLAVADWSVLLLGGDAADVDALDAVGALLHHAPAPYGHVRIAEELQARGPPAPGLEEKPEKGRGGKEGRPRGWPYH